MIQIKNINFSYNGKKILKNIDFNVENGKILSILGPNGSGKTTLLKVIAGILKPDIGEVIVNGKNFLKMQRREMAKLIAYVPQNFEPGFDFTVFDIVSMGRFPHKALLETLDDVDYEKIEWALKVTGLEDLKMKSIREISGGERQRTIIAMALAQDAQIILMDEPTSNLDIRYQLNMLELIKNMVKEGRTIILTMHDVNLSIRYSDEVIVLSEGEIYSKGKPDDIIDEKTIENVYGIKTKILRNGSNRISYILPVVEENQGL